MSTSKKCGCDMCERYRSFNDHLNRVPVADRAFWEGVYEALFHAELDRDHAQAIIDGSWPRADEMIELQRQTAGTKYCKCTDDVQRNFCSDRDGCVRIKTYETSGTGA